MEPALAVLFILNLGALDILGQGQKKCGGGV